jgi:broad specificity phosphatase PhoE
MSGAMLGPFWPAGSGTEPPGPGPGRGPLGEKRPEGAAGVVSFVRHGQVHNPGAVFYGRLPRFALSALGREEAQAAAVALGDEPLAAVFSSPLLRARQTAQEILRGRDGLKLRLSRLLIEVKTPFDGEPSAEVRSRGDDVYTGAGPGFEQPADVLSRTLRFITRALEEFPGHHVVAVTHGDPIAFVAAWAGGLEIVPRSKTRLAPLGIAGGYPATGSITTLSFPASSPDSKPRLRYRRPLR